jgi:hypothetical protein
VGAELQAIDGFRRRTACWRSVAGVLLVAAEQQNLGDAGVRRRPEIEHVGVSTMATTALSSHSAVLAAEGGRLRLDAGSALGAAARSTGRRPKLPSRSHLG